MSENIGFSNIENAIAEAAAKIHERFAAAEYEMQEELAKIWLAAADSDPVAA